MKERPILFSGAMIRAILAGQKTQTRRVVKTHRSDDAFVLLDRGSGWWPYRSEDGESEVMGDGNEYPYQCPYGQPGDRLWVRESWFQRGEWNPYCGPEGVDWEDARWIGSKEIVYAADRPKPEGDPNKRIFWRSRPSIHMPRWASRILLEIVSVRVERLQDISEADAEAEGCERLDSDRDERDWKICPQCGGTRLHSAMGGGGGVIFDCDCRKCDTYVKRYRHLWDGINGEGSWAANPWVWVVEFKRVEGQPL